MCYRKIASVVMGFMLFIILCACSAQRTTQGPLIKAETTENPTPTIAPAPTENLAPATSVKSATQESTKEYWRILTYTASLETFVYSDSFEFEYVQVKNIKDEDLQNKINETLKIAATEWLDTNWGRFIVSDNRSKPFEPGISYFPNQCCNSKHFTKLDTRRYSEKIRIMFHKRAEISASRAGEKLMLEKFVLVRDR